MDFETVKKELIADEDKRNFAYKCTAGKTTIGIGRNLDDKGISDQEIDLLFKNDFHEVVDDLDNIFIDFRKYPQEFQHILFNMRFQLGSKGFRGFKNMIAACHSLSLKKIEEEMMDSEWYTVDTPERAKRLVDRVRRLRTGE